MQPPGVTQPPLNPSEQLRAQIDAAMKQFNPQGQGMM
jgi:hypothetical protein